MDNKTVRLECLKLRHSHAKSIDEILADAKKLEEYINEEPKKLETPTAKPVGKNKSDKAFE